MILLEINTPPKLALNLQYNLILLLLVFLSRHSPQELGICQMSQPQSPALNHLL